MKRIQKNIMPSGRSFFISFGGTIVASFLLPKVLESVAHDTSQGRGEREEEVA